jgi:hypothetical protein
MALLQTAFSHNGFSQKRSGFFRSVVKNKRVAGPILITHTKNDKAVGLAYPAASRISRDNASGFGDADDEFGGLGNNGAQQMEEGEVFQDIKELLPIGQPLPVAAGQVSQPREQQIHHRSKRRRRAWLGVRSPSRLGDQPRHRVVAPGTESSQNPTYSGRARRV